METIRASLFILYVSDQQAGKRFYEAVLDRPPTLDVPGMTEFTLGEGTRLGLMPERGIRALLGLGEHSMPGPGRIRCELYLAVDDPGAYHARALAAGATGLSDLAPRDWGDEVAYSLDPDGHLLAFARRDGGLPR